MESHATPSIEQRKDRHICERFLLLFTRRDNLQRHARTACRLNEKMMRERCECTFDARARRKRNVTRCNDDEPYVPKRSNPTTTESIPIFDDTVVPLSRYLLSDLQDVCERCSNIRTSMIKGPVQTRHIHRFTTLHTNALRNPLIIMFQEQTTALNQSTKQSKLRFRSEE